MAPPKKDTPLKSPLVSAFNNIVNINRSKSQMKSTQTSYNEFLKFMTSEVKNIEAIKLPDEKKIKKLANINVSSTFGSAGSLLSGLASGALDAAGLVGDFFGGRKGGKGGKTPKKPSVKAGKPIPKGKKIRLPGVRGLPIISAALAGLDFAQGISEGESTGKAGAGAVGSAAGAAGGALAGSALAGAIGQALVPIPGLGFVLGAAVGSLGAFAGGYLADRAYEATTGEGKVKEKQKSKLKQQEQQQKAKAASLTQATFPQVLDKFDSVVTKFEKAASAGLIGPSSSSSEEVSEEQKEIMEGDLISPPNTNQQEGTTGDYSVSGGFAPSSKRGSPFGPRGSRNHNGIDYLVGAGTPISVVQPGTVSVSDMNYDPGGWGALVEVHHQDGTSTRYAHLSKITVSKGQKIEPGTLIGYSGGTPGAPGAGNSRGEHLHYEYLPKGSGPKDPAAGSNDDKYFRFGGNVTVKPVVKPQQNMAGQEVSTQQPNQPDKPQAPSTSAARPTADMAKKFQMAWDNRNNPFARGRIESAWDQMTPEQQGQAKTWAQSKGYDWTEMKLKEKPQTVQAASTVVPVPSMQQSVPEQIEQYPDYNLPQSSITLMPIIMGGGGGGSQQRPMVIAGGGGGGGGTMIMPPTPEGQVLNSLFKTILLTNLSGT